MKCRICFDNCDEDHPDTVFGLNPETFRRGIMHWWCFVSSREGLEGIEPKRPTKFVDRQDEYDQAAQVYPQ